MTLPDYCRCGHHKSEHRSDGCVKGWDRLGLNGGCMCPAYADDTDSNPYCNRCGDLRGGPYGHDTNECTWRHGNPAHDAALAAADLAVIEAIAEASP